MMMAPRDSQRSRVYEAERKVYVVGGVMTLAECQQWVDGIVSWAWWAPRSRITKVGVRSGRGSTAWAKKEGFLPIIVLPPRQRCKWIILHELAHHMTPSHNASHGPEFCANYVALTRQFLGKEQGDALKVAFRAMKVSVRGVAKVHIRRSVCNSCHDVVGERSAWQAKVGVGMGTYYFCSKRCGSTWLMQRLSKVSASF